MSAVFRAEREVYVRETLNPILQPLVAAVLKETPHDPREFMRQWLLRRSAAANDGQVQVTQEELPGGQRRKLYRSRTSIVKTITLHTGGKADSAEKEVSDCSTSHRSASASVGDFGLPPPAECGSSETKGRVSGAARKTIQFNYPVQVKEEEAEGGGKRKSYWSRQSVVVAMENLPEKEDAAEKTGAERRPVLQHLPTDFGLLPPSEHAGDAPPLPTEWAGDTQPPPIEQVDNPRP
eukprot:CAMPEP_0171093604 /NCGR_PEP_ID=MMETSP0766_2-20121228/39177_1 /TAXON_ID=439317 /ORGANISM="Gambierdiscus australes, Strain CAWD 149" /LENGTH=235 /DNA_ID=CAMNT_0011552077 /DNA_START=73 /DNA_END=777 /DNA_ORIENTATION=-